MRSGDTVLLRNFLETYWLKPFDAVWDASTASVISDVPMEEPSLDLGCGDGLFMLVALGGRARLAYDRYTASFDSLASDRPSRVFTIGMDWKAGMLDKAKHTHAYRHLIRADGQKLPFADGSFSTVFCNILYWLPDWRAALREMRRVLREDGRLILVVPDRSFGNHLRAHHWAQQYRQQGWVWAANFFEWIDNGRFGTLTRLTGGRAEWKQRFAEVGLALSDSFPVLAPEAVTRWDFSTRPVLHGLVMAGRVLQAVGLKSAVKRLIVPLVERAMRPWLRRSVAAAEDACGLWVLVAEPALEAARCP